MKLTNLICFLKMSNDSDYRINLSSLDQMTGPTEISQVIFAISNSPRSGYGEIRIFKMILRISNSQ